MTTLVPCRLKTLLAIVGCLALVKPASAVCTFPPFVTKTQLVKIAGGPRIVAPTPPGCYTLHKLEIPDYGLYFDTNFTIRVSRPSGVMR